MKGIIKFLPAIILIFAGCMLWSTGAGRYREMDMEYGGISLRFETTPVTIDRLNETLRQQSDSTNSKLAAWKQDYNIEIEDRNLGVSIESDVIYIWGNRKNIFGLSGITGCAISEDKAYELWGSYNILGKDIYIDGISYKITCVTDAVSGIIAVKKDNYDGDMKFVSLDMEPEALTGESDIQIEKFVLQNSQGSDSSINYSDLISILGSSLVLPSLAVSILMCGRIMSCFNCSAKNKLYREFACYLFVLISWICICFFSGSFLFEIPGNFIPVKWSDFEFWTRLIKRYENDLNGFRLMQTYIFDSYFRKYFINISVCGLSSSICFIAALRRVINKSLNSLIVFEIVLAFVMFFAAVSSGAQYGRFGSSYWLTLPAYFVFDYLINNFNLRERA